MLHLIVTDRFYYYNFYYAESALLMLRLVQEIHEKRIYFEGELVDIVETNWNTFLAIYNHYNGKNKLRHHHHYL